MSFRKRSPRPFRIKSKRHFTMPLLENLEERLVLSQSATSPMLPIEALGGSSVTSLAPGIGVVNYPLASGGTALLLSPGTSWSTTNETSQPPNPITSGIILGKVPTASPLNASSALTSAGPAGYIPSQIESAYGVNQIMFGGIKGDGTGQTIGIYEEGYNPAFNSSPGAPFGALSVFDQTFGIPNPPSLKFFDSSGNPLTPASPDHEDYGAGVEIALDIEWAHAMAPGASIDVLSGVPDSNNYYEDIPQGMAAVAALPGVSVVSVSYGWFLDYYDKIGLEQSWNSDYIQAALEANPNVSFFVSSGDSSAAYGVLFPSASPDVVSVGGTSLYLTSNDQYLTESGWSDGGGGYSQAFTIPSYQENDGFAGNNGQRTNPDVAADADPNTGVAVYDPYDFGDSTPWAEIGGTSVAAPLWAGMATIADQGRALAGGLPLSSNAALSNSMQADIYNLNILDPQDFHDITKGNNGYPAGPDYDLVTGLGSPVANALIPQLAAYGLGNQTIIADEPPSSVVAGGQFGVVVAAETSSGVVDPGFNGTAAISISAGPAGGDLIGTTDVTFSNGLAVFDGLSMNTLSDGTDYTFQISVQHNSAPFETLTTTRVDVATAATSGVGVFYPLPIDSSLRRDTNMAGSDSANATDILYFVYSTDYQITSGQLLLENTSGLQTKIIELDGGQEESSTVITANGTSRVFDIVNSNSSLDVVMTTLTIEGGKATDDGGLNLPNAAVGGGLIVDGGHVTLSNVGIQSNVAAGGTGSTGAPASSRGGPGGAGDAGGKALGGGFYLATGSLTLINSTVSGNLVLGGLGGNGGSGGAGYELIETSFGGIYVTLSGIVGGAGGAGGNGGSGVGGGAYVANGQLILNGADFSSNQAFGGSGGQGGNGGHGGLFSKTGGAGGQGGNGGKAAGGGIYVAAGTVSLANGTTISTNSVLGGTGGLGGRGGTGGTTSSATTSSIGRGPSGATGAAGGSALASGGGLYVAGGSISVTSATIEKNMADFGGGIYNTKGNLGFSGLTIENNYASMTGGGIWNSGTLTLTGSSVNLNTSVEDAGGLYNKGTLVVNTSAVTYDSALSGSGGGIENLGTLNVGSTQFSHDVATSGSGGAISNSGQASILDGNSFQSNSATNSGGAIANLSGGSLSVSQAAFTANATNGDGGAINSAGTTTIVNSTLAFNTANKGGAIFTTGVSLEAIDVTIVYNQSMISGGGGGLDASAGTVAIYDSIVALNTDGVAGPADDIAGTVSKASAYNLIGTYVVGGLNDTNQIGVTAGELNLEPLANNGGTTETFALGVGSVAINAGSAKISGVTVPIIDQRGLLRGSPPDIGAYNISSGYLVTNTADSYAEGTLRSAVLWANTNQASVESPGPNTIVFDTSGVFSTAQTITLLLGVLELSNTTTPIVIDYTGTTSVDIDGAGAMEVFQVDSGVTATFTKLTISGGSAVAGAGIYNSGALIIDQSSIIDNVALTDGGGIYNYGTLTVTGDAFTGNSAPGGAGGGIFNFGQLTVLNSTFNTNSAPSGGGILNQGTMSVSNGTFTSNVATGTSSSASGGGAIYNSGTATVSNSNFASNAAAYGGAVYVSTGSLTLNASTFSGNTASVDGGAFVNAIGTVTINGSTLSGNTAASGGGLFDGSDASSNLTNTTIAGNTATTGPGSGIEDYGSLAAVNVTIAYNLGSGGLDVESGGSAFLYNTIVALNLDGTSPSDITGAGTVSGSNNLVGVGGSDGLSGSDNLLDVANPALGSLANNGGPTETIALLTNSPAIDAGSATIPGAPKVDQRGALRGAASDGGLNAGLTPDIGAYEASSSFLVTTTDDGLIAGSLRSAVNWANFSTNDNPMNLAPNTPAPNTIVFGITGTISLTDGVLELTNTTTPIAIDGPGLNNLDRYNVDIDANGNGGAGVFQVDPGVTATFTEMEISGASSTTAVGGGIDNLGNVTVDDVLFTDNTSLDGAGIYNAGTLSVVDSTFSLNNAVSGAGIFSIGTGKQSILDSGFTSNAASGSTSSAGGGGLFVDAGGVSVSGSTFSQNTAANGGAIFVQSGSLSVNYSTFNSNSATVQGGAIDNLATLNILGSTLSGNSAPNGGGLANDLSGIATLTNDTVTGNSATSTGGGSATGNGGGIENSGILTTVNLTIADNTAINGGGGIFASSGTTALYNTIVAINTSGSNPSDISGTVTGSYNLIGTGGSGGLNDNNGNQIGVTSSQLNLGALAGNGGVTSTLALGTGSVAIDAGSASIAGVTVPTIDQRGALRGPSGLDAGSTVDVGAYEASSSYLVTTTTDSTDVGTLRAALAWAQISTNANPENPTPPAPNTVVFDTSGVFSTPQTITLSPVLGTLQVTQGSVAIVGPGQGGVTISGGNAIGVFEIYSGATVSMAGLTITGGGDVAFGGGILNGGGTLTLTADTITGNSAIDGGGVLNQGTLTVVDSTFSGNTALLQGAAIDNVGSATLTNCTIADNTVTGGISGGNGGGIFNEGTLLTVNVTIAYNSAFTGGGGIFTGVGNSTTLYNTIVASNTSGSSNELSQSDISGTVTGWYNLIGTGGSGGLVAGQDGNQVGVANPGLAAYPGLANNGGPTQTIALLPGSPAIQMASATIITGVPTTDQRGALRNPDQLTGLTTIDVGAYEISSVYEVTNTTDSWAVGTLRSAIAWAGANPTNPSNPMTNTIVFDFTTPETITLSPVLGTLKLSNPIAPTSIEGPGTYLVNGVTTPLITISGAGEFGVFKVDPGVTVTISELALTEGNATNGGAIDNNQGTVTLVDSLLSDNGATQSGGAIYNLPGSNGGTVTLTDTSLIGNSTILYGGGIYNAGGTVAIAGGTFSDNEATYGIGGAIDNTGTMSISNATIDGNTSFYGGGVNNSGAGTLTISQSTIDGNTGIMGGGVWNDGTLTVTATTIADNSGFAGGGISNNLPGTLTLVNSTIANNTAGQYGAGIDNAGTLTAVNDTIAYNVVAAGGAGGGLITSVGTTALYNTIVALNYTGTLTTGGAADVSGNVLLSSSYNLIGLGGAGGLINGVNGNLVGVTQAGAQLGTLASNGGPTETIALLTGSAAIGKGSSTIPGVKVPNTDQRGYPRPSASIDIGAYQTPLIPPPLTVRAELAAVSTPITSSVTTALPVGVGAAPVADNISAPADRVVTLGRSPSHVKKVVGKGHSRPTAGSAAVFHKTARQAVHRNALNMPKHEISKSVKKK